MGFHLHIDQVAYWSGRDFYHADNDSACGKEIGELGFFNFEIYPEWVMNVDLIKRIYIIFFVMLEFAAVLTTGGILLFSTTIDIEKSILLELINRIIDSKNL